MRVAVNARFLLADYVEGIGGFTFEVAKRLVRDHPDDEFLFFFDRPYDRRFVCGDNVRPIVLSPPARHPVLWLWWFELSLAKAFTRHRPDVFLSGDGFLSLRAQVPTLLFVHDVAFERFAEGIGKLQHLYYRTMTPRWVRRAAKVATVSEFSKRELMAAYDLDSDRIDVIYNGVGEAFRPAPSAEQVHVRERYAGGSDYFLHVGSIHPRKNVANLLRAFDDFRRRSRRPIKLLLAGRLAWRYEDVLQAHAAMEHGDDVIFLGYVPAEELPAVFGAALAVVCVSLYEGFGLPVVEAMACAVPVIASARAAIPEIAGEAALFVEPDAPESIAAAMDRVAADADLRRDLARLGLQRATRFNWDTTAAAVWSALTRIAGTAG